MMTTHDRVRIWDLAIRLFHWLLLVLVVTSFATAKIGGNAMTWHMYSGYTILALIVFRVLWGLAGSRYALFSTFIRGPRETWVALMATLHGTTTTHAGHNPLGALSVVALLAALLTQAVSGLFANDDIATEGPLAKLVSGAVSELLTQVHGIGERIIVALVILHLAAIAFYFFVKRDNLVRPMITGDKSGIAAPSAQDDRSMRLRALILAATAAGLVAYIVNL